MIPEVPTLTGRFITLTPLDPVSDSPALFDISHTPGVPEALWRWMPAGPFADVEAMRQYFQNWQANPDVRAFTVRTLPDGQPVGSISLMSIRPPHGVAELGNIWYAPSVQRTKVNTEANFLLLRHCFETLGYRRMEWKCNALNAPSRQAALRLGYRFEGIFRQHMIVKGQNRDTAWFSIIDQEWAKTGQALAHWLYEDDSQALGSLTRLGEGTASSAP
ncbi:MAG: GNAT family protein [Verrucomicrobiota bacterium]